MAFTEASASWDALGGLQISSAVDPRIRRGLAEGRPLLLLARQSGPQAASTNRAVARDAIEAVAALKCTLGIDSTEHLPEQTTIVEALAASSDVITSLALDDERPFTNTYATFDLRPQGVQLILLFSAGTSKTLDTSRQQPFIVRLADMVEELRPCLLFSKTDSRMLRQDWPQAPLRVELERADKAGEPVLVGSESGLDDSGIFADAQHLYRGNQSKREAENFTQNTRRTIVTHTGLSPRMDQGHVAYYLAGAVAPGLTRITLRQKGGSRHVKGLYLDCPKVLPDQHDALTHLPATTDADGRPICQVDIVRWALRHIGKEGWTQRRVADELGERGYSTDAVRARYGPDARANVDTPAVIVGRTGTLLRNLSLYETGSFERSVGDQVVRVSNIFPIDGPWADPEDFARIRAWSEELTREREHRKAFTFSGLAVICNNTPGRLRPVPSRDLKTSADARYLPGPLSHAATRTSLSHPDTAAASTAVEQTDRLPQVAIRHSWLAESIVDAVIEGQTLPLRAVTHDEHDEELAKLRRQQSRHDAMVQAMRAAVTAKRATAEEQLANGDFVVPPRSRANLWQEIEDLEDKVAIQTQTGAQLEHAAQARQDRVALLHRGLEVDRLLDVLTSLRDPHDVTYRADWLPSIVGLEIEYQPVKRNGSAGTHITWHFKFRLSQGDVIRDLPVFGERTVGALSRAEERTQALVDDLRHGYPLSRRSKARLLLPAIKAALGREALNSPQLLCKDPTLLRLHLQLLDAYRLQPDLREAIIQAADDPEFRDTFQDPTSLGNHIARAFLLKEPATTKWRTLVGDNEINALHLAGIHQGTPPDGELPGRREDLLEALKRNGRIQHWEIDPHLRLTPCPWCDSLTQAVPRLREMQGYICLECRLDRGKVLWPDQYNDYIVTRETLSPAAPATASPHATESAADVAFKRHTTVPTPPRTLTSVERRELIRVYVEGKTLREVAEQFGVSFDAARYIANEAGVTRPKGRRPSRSTAPEL